jgi:hypothetical protein
MYVTLHTKGSTKELCAYVVKRGVYSSNQAVMG